MLIAEREELAAAKAGADAPAGADDDPGVTRTRVRSTGRRKPPST